MQAGRPALLFPAGDDSDAAGLGDRSRGQGVVDDFGLFLLMALSAAGSGAGALGPAHIAEFAAALVQQGLDRVAEEAPRAHVAGLLLRPDDLGGHRIAREDVAGLVGGEGVELL